MPDDDRRGRCPSAVRTGPRSRSSPWSWPSPRSPRPPAPGRDRPGTPGRPWEGRSGLPHPPPPASPDRTPRCYDCRAAASSRSWSGTTSNRIASYAGRDPRPAGDQSRRDRQPPPGSNRVESYRRFLTSRMTSIGDSIRRTVSGTRILRTFDVVYGGASILVPAGRVRDVLRVPGVVAVQPDRLAHTLTTTTPHFLGADRVWPTLGGAGPGGAERGHRGAGLGHLARTSIVQGSGARTVPPGGRMRVRRRFRPRPGETVHLQPQADRRLRVHRHLHVGPAGHAGRVLRQPDRRVLGTQRRRPRDAHGIDRGRRSRRRRRSSACPADA